MEKSLEAHQSLAPRSIHCRAQWGARLKARHGLSPTDGVTERHEAWLSEHM